MRFSAGLVKLRIGQLHVENIQLLVLEGATTDIILVHLWFAQHEPQISWRTGEVLKWSTQCFPNCFPCLPQPSPCVTKIITLNSTSIESPIEKQCIDIPTSYSPLQQRLLPKEGLPTTPHRPWDCAIDLISGEPVPKGKIYPLSLPEQKAMEEYIEEAWRSILRRH